MTGDTRSLTIVFGMFCLVLSGNTALYGQHEHGQEAASTASSTAMNDEMEHIFCPTMKTGQMCSHGTAATLKLQGESAEAWIALARKYNKAVDAATLQLFEEAEAVLSPEQMTELKAWFAIGLNPQINELLYAKGLGTKKQPAADATAEKKAE